jgi:hypothetical protein
VLPEIGDLVKLAGWDPDGLIGIIIKQSVASDLNPESGLLYTVLWSGVNYTTDLWGRDITLVSKAHNESR